MDGTSNIRFAIVVTTYRKNDKTKALLVKALQSVLNQTYTNFKVFLIGDKYEDETEFLAIARMIPIDRLYYRNLPIARERSKYPMDSEQLWSSGGVHSRNIGIDLALSEGFDYICHLDHDDYWHEQHLELINHTIKLTNNASFIFTCATYFNSYLPSVKLTNEIIEMKPEPCKLIHSSVCVNHREIPLRYRDVYAEEGKIYAADADMWDRVSEYITEHNLKSYLITSLTCFHPTERN